MILLLVLTESLLLCKINLELCHFKNRVEIYLNVTSLKALDWRPHSGLDQCFVMLLERKEVSCIRAAAVMGITPVYCNIRIIHAFWSFTSGQTCFVDILA